MLANQIGYYSLILGLALSFILSAVSIKDFYNNNQGPLIRKYYLYPFYNFFL